ncbi:MAG: FRG domain-containing protein, partial [Vicinamibacterales bacterium]
LKEAHARSFNDRLSRYRSPFAFRGMCADWPLSTSLQRLNHPIGTLQNIERAMFRNFKKYAYADLDPSTSDWKWLAVAQHHGLPTRLLDWTFSPFVAMHFATNELDQMDKDGVLWMVNFDLVRQFMPSSFQSALRKHYALTFSVEMLEEDDDLKHPFVFEQTESGQPPFVMFFEPPSLDPRIVNQWGLFSFMNRLDLRLDEWLSQTKSGRQEIVRKLIIDANAKWEIRDKLDGMNMSERVIMPGLDGLSTWLKRWYSPKSPHPVVVPETPTRASARPAKPSGRPGRVSAASARPARPARKAPVRGSTARKRKT